MLKDLYMAKGAGSASARQDRAIPQDSEICTKGQSGFTRRRKAQDAGGHSLPPSSAEWGVSKLICLERKGVDIRRYMY